MSVGGSAPDGWDTAQRLAGRLGALEGLLDAVFASDERGRLAAFRREYAHKMREWQDDDAARQAARRGAPLQFPGTAAPTTREGRAREQG